jgi:hypothetical protein
VREAIEARRASLIYLPPYSPNLNPSSRRCCAKPHSPSANAPTISQTQGIDGQFESALAPPFLTQDTLIRSEHSGHVSDFAAIFTTVGLLGRGTKKIYQFLEPLPLSASPMV